MGRKGYIVAGCFFGDEGKGLAVDALVREHKADLVIKYTGGPQASHAVVLDDGREHRFAQFGSGTFTGARTWLSKHVLVEPFAMINEADALSQVGVDDPLEFMSVHPDCLIITPWHWMLNQLRETCRGDKRHGSCGMGIGETRRAKEDWDLYLTVGMVKNLDHKSLVQVLNEFQTYLGMDAMAIMEEYDFHGAGNELIQKMKDENVEDLAHFYKDWSGKIGITTRPVRGAGNVVLEGAQGVLLDENHGFAPYNTWSTTTFANALEVCRDLYLEPVKIGVMRTYLTRHGAGPFPTEHPAVSFADHNTTGRWQGAFRQGYFDMVMARYAVDVCGGIDEIFLTHCDCVGREWRYATSYEIDSLSPKDRTEMLMNCSVVTETVKYEEMVPILEKVLKAPVTRMSFGPTANDVKVSTNIMTLA